MNRKLAREAAYLTVFGYLFTGELNAAAYRHLSEPLKGDREKEDTQVFDETLNGLLDASDLEYIARITGGVAEREKELKGIIAKYAAGYVLDRVYKPDLAALLIAIYEMKYEEKIPLKVSIAEAVGLVKIYSTTKSSSFVNGILASVYKEIEGNGSDN